MAASAELRCRVVGCTDPGRVSVGFVDDYPAKFTDYVDPADTTGEGLLVCFAHGARLGEVKSYGPDIDPDAFYVDVGPQAAGWAFVLEISGAGFDLRLVPPDPPGSRPVVVHVQQPEPEPRIIVVRDPREGPMRR